MKLYLTKIFLSFNAVKLFRIKLKDFCVITGAKSESLKLAATFGA